MATNHLLKIHFNTSDEDCRMMCEAEIVKQLLNFCTYVHGAKITIIVEHDNGHKAIAQLYDHASLVQSLYDALDNFQSEML